jgi:crossover junction endodeoxyribonuclease RusA
VSRTWEIRLPWTSPPLSLNDRSHWRKRAADVQATRAGAALAVAIQHPSLGFKPLAHIDVRLTYIPRDKRRRDPDNLVATYKVCCDALVDPIGIVPDDEPRYMTKHMPVIAEPDGDPRLVLRIEEVP